MTEIKILRNILAANQDQAGRNRERLRRHGLLALNLIASPGAGKTTLVERTIAGLAGRCRCAVIEGDITGDHDARRIAAAGAPVVQVNTEGGCHLDAAMVDRALGELDLDAVDILVIENVGNLVCPAEFDLGEASKVVVLSVPEGDDKPAKYPLIFSEAAAVVINKVDLLAATDFDYAAAERDIRKINPSAPLFPMSCRSGRGLDPWLDWLAARRKDHALT
jgi:hydrogenase nickel incorporation protein HypB